MPVNVFDWGLVHLNQSSGASVSSGSFHPVLSIRVSRAGAGVAGRRASSLFARSDCSPGLAVRGGTLSSPNRLARCPTHSP